MDNLRKRRLSVALVLAALLVPGLARAAGPKLGIQQIELTQKNYPRGRAYFNLLGNSGQPLQSQSPELFHVYEDGAKSSSKVLKVDPLDNAGAGASIVVVVQASGGMKSIKDDLKKAVSGFVNSLAEKDQVAIVSYAEAAETVSTFSADKGEVAAKANKIEFAGTSFLLYDGLAQALSLYQAAGGPPAKGGAAAAKAAPESLLPVAKAIIVISDGRDNGSATDVEKIISDAKKRNIPVHTVAHSEVEQDFLRNLEELSKATYGTYQAAVNVEDIGKGLTRIKEFIGKMYVLDWRTALPHDGKEHTVSIAYELDGVPPVKSEVKLKTPEYTDWMRIGIIAGGILLLLIIIAVIYVVTRPKPAPQRFCPVCKRVQMPEWDICLFCLKAAKGRMLVQKGAQKGKMYPLVGKIVNIGSGPENGIRLMDGSISGKHAGVAIDDTKFEIVDLGSKNGVLVNGKKTPRRFLRNGDIITLGMTELKFETTVKTNDDEDEESAED